MKIEEMKKILVKYGDFMDADPAVGVEDILDIDEAFHQICQLFPKSPDNPEGYEVKISQADLSEIKQGLKEISEGKVIPLSQLEVKGDEGDEGELLTPNEAKKAVQDYRRILELNGHRPTTEDSRYAIKFAQRDLTASIERGKCQERIRYREAVILTIISDMFSPQTRDKIKQALKKQEGVK